MLTITIDTARRFILGKQGVWPGRRWRGIEGTEQAMRAMEYLQLDPLYILARSQDIQLHSRVLDYTPGLWEDLAYRQRKFFDWGGWLADEAFKYLLGCAELLPHHQNLLWKHRGKGRRRKSASSCTRAQSRWMRHRRSWQNCIGGAKQSNLGTMHWMSLSSRRAHFTTSN
jgi:uncharacterized protein YcaQ